MSLKSKPGHLFSVFNMSLFLSTLVMNPGTLTSFAHNRVCLCVHTLSRGLSLGQNVIIHSCTHSPQRCHVITVLRSQRASAKWFYYGVYRGKKCRIPKLLPQRPFALLANSERAPSSAMCINKVTG